MVFDLRLGNPSWVTKTSLRVVDTQCGELGTPLCFPVAKTRADNLNRFPNEDMIADPLTAQYCENGDTFNGWIGPDMHFRE